MVIKQRNMCVRYLILTGCLLSVAIYLVYNFTDVALYYGRNYESVGGIGDENEDDNSTNTTEHCPNRRIITVHDLGNIGNVIWEYMSLYAVSKLYAEKERFKPYLKEGMKKKLEGFFESLSIPGRTITYNDTVHSTMLPRDEPTRPEFMINGCRNLLINNSSVRYEEVLQLGVADLKKELRFREKYAREASQTLRSIQSSFGLQGKSNVTFVGMHYRGTDYIAHLKRFHRKTFKGPPDYKYYVGGMNYFKARHEEVIFVLTTIDGDWLKINEPFLTQNGNVAINPYKRSAVKDLVLLSHCNHTIVNYGTYGVTAALLNEGTTIVYDLGVPLNHRGQTVATGIATILENWLVFGYDGNNVTLT